MTVFCYFYPTKVACTKVNYSTTCIDFVSKTGTSLQHNECSPRIPFSPQHG